MNLFIKFSFFIFVKKNWFGLMSELFKNQKEHVFER